MSHLTYFSDAGVGTIELNSPPANSYGIELMRELGAAIHQAEADSECKAVIVRSGIYGFFCGGADIKQFHKNEPHSNIEMITLAHETLSKMSYSSKIYMAEIAGHALGGGLEIALACDFRFAAAGTYKLGLPEVTLGILPGNGGTQRLSALIGVSKALELMTFGTRLTPGDAERLGIINRLFDPAELSEKVTAIATALSASATLAIGKIKRSVYDGYCHALASGLAIERRNISALFYSADAREGFAAFAEHRNPEFSGK